MPDRAARRCLIDVDRQKAALVVMGVPFRTSLMAVHHFERAHRCLPPLMWWHLVAPAPDVDERSAQADDLLQRRLPLRAPCQAASKQHARVGRLLAGKLEGGIAAQPVEVIAIRVAAGDRQHAPFQYVLNCVRNMRPIAPVGDQSSESLGESPPTLGKREQHDAAVGGETTAIEGSCDFLARHGWIGNGERVIVGHGGCGSALRRA